MANPVQAQEILDFNGVSSKIREVKSEIKDFGSESQKLISILSAETNKYGNEVAALIETLKKIKVTGDPSAPLSDAAKKTKELADATKILTQAQQDLINSGKLSTTALKELEAEQKEITKAYKTLISEQKSESAEALILKQRLEQLSEKTNLLNAQLKLAKKATQDATGSYNELQKSLSRDITELKKLEGVFTTTNGKVTVNKEKIDQLTKSINQKNQALKDVDKAMGNNQRNVGNYSSALAFLNGGMRGLIGSAGAVGIAILALGELYSNTLAPIIELTSKQQTLEFTIRNVSTTTTQYEANLSMIKATANKLGLDINALAVGFKLLAGSTKDTALAGVETQKIFLSVAEASAAMKLSAEDTEGALRAVSQMLSKGTVSAEELRGQLAERVPNAFNLAAKAIGVTTQELSKMLKNGDVLALSTLPKIAQALHDTYSADASKNIETIQGQTTKLKNTWQEFISLEANPFVRALGTIEGSISGFLDRVNAKLSRGGSGISSFFESLFNIRSRKDVAGDEANRVLAEFNTLDLKSQRTRIDMIGEERTKLEQQLETIKEANKGKAELAKQNTAFIEQELTINKKLNAQLNTLYNENKTNLERASKELSEAKAVKDAEEADKLAKKAKAQFEKDITEQRRKYQIELRELDAKEKSALNILETSNVEGYISDEQFAQSRLELTSKFLVQKNDLIAKYSKGNLSIEKDLIDDKARLEEEGNKNILDSTKIRMEALKRLLRDYLEAENLAYTQQNQNRAKQIAIGFDEIDANTAKRQASVDRPTSLNKKGLSQQNPIQKTQSDIDKIVISIDGIYQKMNLVNQARIDDEKAILDVYAKTEFEITSTMDDNLIRQEALKDAASKRDIALVKARGDREVQYADLVKKLEEAKTDKEKEEAQKRIDIFNQEHERKQMIIQKSFEIARELSDSLSQVSKSRSEYEINNLEKQKTYEIGLAGDNAEAKIRIEQQYDKKIAELKRKQAIADKALALFNIGLSTAQAIMSHTKLPPPANAIMIGLDIALAALQVATVVATPIPEFAKGKKRGDQYKGIGLVGEAGTEIVEKDGKKQVFDKPTLTYLDPNTTVYTARETERMLADKRGSSNYMASMEYNRNFINKSMEFKQNQNGFKAIDFSDKNVTNAIEKGFDGINIWLNNDDGSITKKRGNSIVKNNTNRSIYYQ